MGLAVARERARSLKTEAENKPETTRITFDEVLENDYRIHGPKQRHVTRKECQRLLNNPNYG